MQNLVSAFIFQALEMFVLVLQQCHRESEERWKRLSRQVTDILLPALARQQVSYSAASQILVRTKLATSNGLNKPAHQCSFFYSLQIKTVF